MPEFSISKIIEHHFHFNDDKGELGIGYDMIIDRYLITQLGLTTKFKCQILQWDGATVPMKEPIGLLWKSDLNKRNMHGVVMQTAEPASTRKATDRLVKILGSYYLKAELKQVANNATQLNAEERTQVLRLLEYSGDFFNGTLGYWDT